MDISDFVTSAEGLFVAIGSMTLGMAKLIHELIRLLRWILARRKAKKAKIIEVEVSVSKRYKISINSIWLIVLPLLFSGTVLSYRWKVLSALPLDVRLTKQAWDTYNKKKYESAIRYAEECINEFKGAADREQHGLEQENASLPPTGKVSDQERETIWKRGLLNAVGTCFYIKGRSLEALGQKQEAITVYKEASRYTYARCWDPKIKIFWSPAETALDRLQLLEK